jgi:peptide-methionine (S)-S-oxide reductase
MKKLFFIFILSISCYFSNNTFALSSSHSVNTVESMTKYKKAYFAGGCFWCMEESFDKVKGVIKSISGYSGGHVKNPTYKQVIYKDTGHVEAITVLYNPKLTSYEKLLEVFWENIDPFDGDGQFCDKGKSYRSVAFYQNIKQKKLIENSILKIEKRFNEKKVVTLVWKFQEFYLAEDYHQDYYQKNFLRYLAYKSSCQREEILKKIWN